MCPVLVVPFARDLSHQRLTGDVTALGLLMNLVSLDVSGNKFTDLNGLQTLTKLQKLISTNGALTSLPDFSKMDALLEVDFTNNKLATITSMVCSSSST